MANKALYFIKKPMSTISGQSPSPAGIVGDTNKQTNNLFNSSNTGALFNNSKILNLDSK
jgi:hypothetical protein